MAQPTQPRYDKLLDERIAAGRRLVHALVHPEASREVDALYRAVQQTEARLTRFRRYSHDQLLRVVPEEDAAFHAPSEGDGDLGSDCAWCARRELGISAPIPLPKGGSDTRRSA